MKWLWISGWTISPSWFVQQAQAIWPEHEHHAVSPSAAAKALADGGFDALGGYSLGTLWLLRHAHLISKDTPVVLLAPIFAFTAEAALGGRISKAILGIQRHRFQQDASAAVRDFFLHAGLGDEGLHEAVNELTPARIAELLEELDWLRDWSANPPPLENWQGFAGEGDVLLDALLLKRFWPTLRIVRDAGHSAVPLLREVVQQENNSQIVESFNAAAENYDAHAGPQAMLAKATANLVAPSERHGSALEFGAGTGLFTRAVQPWNGSYLATDAAPRMVAIGQKLCPAAQWRRLEAGEANDIQPVQWIFACNVLQWLEEPENILRHWRTLAAPQGQLVASILLPETLGELRAVLPEAHSLAWRSAEEWKALLTQAGFAIEQTETWEHISQHPSSLALLRDLHAMGLSPRQSVGPGRLRAALREYDRRFPHNGGVRATWRALLVRATAAA